MQTTGEFEVLLKAYVFGPNSEYSFVLDLTTGAPYESCEYIGIDLFKKEVHLKLETPVLLRNSPVCFTRHAKRQFNEWCGYTKSLMRRIGLENDIPDEAFTRGRHLITLNFRNL